MFDSIREVTPYVPGEQPDNSDYIKLNTNESPYPPSPKVLEAYQNFKPETLRLYPKPEPYEMQELLAGQMNLKSEQVFLGNGSDEVLALCMLTFFNSERPILFADVTYSFYPVWCSLFRIPYKTVPLQDDFHISKEGYVGNHGGIILVNPNAPTTLYESLDTIEFILKNNQHSIVIVDEAYIDFGGQSAVPLIQRYPNLVVVHTFSKSRSLAGLRIGYAMGNESLITALHAVKNAFNSYTLDTVAQCLGTAALQDTAYYRRNNEQIIQTREWFVTELKQLGFQTLPSMANFVFTTHPEIAAEKLFQYLKEQKILVRYFSKPERIRQYLRITIGVQEDMQQLLDALQKFIRG